MLHTKKRCSSTRLGDIEGEVKKKLRCDCDWGYERMDVLPAQHHDREKEWLDIVSCRHEQKGSNVDLRESRQALWPFIGLGAWRWGGRVVTKQEEKWKR
jgi:hypothetical protein